MPWQDDIYSAYALDPASVSALERLLEMLVAQNDRNLTAVTSPEGIVRLHFLDSLWLLTVPEMDTATTLIDVGSGAGFPGLPLAIARPSLNVTLLEANGKKADFITKAVETLGLKNASVLNMRAEEAGRTEVRDTCDIALARAVGSLPEVLEYTIPLIRPGGHALLQRGARAKGDEKTASGAANQLRSELLRIQPASPYKDARNLNLWVFEKIDRTPDKYPRRPGVPRKRPLGT